MDSIFTISSLYTFFYPLPFFSLFSFSLLIVGTSNSTTNITEILIFLFCAVFSLMFAHSTPSPSTSTSSFTQTSPITPTIVLLHNVMINPVIPRFPLHRLACYSYPLYPPITPLSCVRRRCCRRDVRCDTRTSSVIIFSLSLSL